MHRLLLILVIVTGQLFFSHTSVAARKVLDVPYSQQFQAFTCGHESLRMVLAYWGQRESREKILIAVGANSSTIPHLRKVIKKNFKAFQADVVGNDLSAIKAQIDAGRPVLISAQADKLSYLDYESTSGHMVIAVGYDDASQVVFIRDSNSPYVESLSFSEFKSAMVGGSEANLVVYKVGAGPPAGPAQNFNRAYGLGSKKSENRIPLSWIVPAIYLSYETEPRQNLGQSFKDSSKRGNRKFAISWNGVSYGRQTMENTPWLGNGKVFHTIGFGGAWTPGRNLRLVPTELLSPGIYDFGRYLALDVHQFGAIKKLPWLSLKKHTLEVTGYMKPADDESLSYESLGVEAVAWSGARFGWRRGWSDILGHIGAGASLGKVDLKFDGSDQIFSTHTINYDLNLGLINGAVQTTNFEAADSVDEQSRDEFSVVAYSIGVKYNLSMYQSRILNAINRIGLLRPHIELTHEKVSRNVNAVTNDIQNRRWDLEFPVPMHYVDMTYGASLLQSTDKNGVDDFSRSAWFRFAFKAYQPLLQLTAGYRVFYKDFEETLGQQISLGMFFGI